MAVPSAEMDTTRAKLLAAATAVFSERGYDGAGVHEIARRAGLTTGAIYANFKGKADLLLEAVGARSADELDGLLGPQWGRQQLTAAELLVDLGSHLLDPPDEGGMNADLLIEALFAARRDPDLSDLVKGLIGERIRAIGAIVEVAQQEGSVAPSVSADAFTSFSIVLALGSLLYTSVGIDRPDDQEWSALIHRIVASLQEDSP